MRVTSGYLISDDEAKELGAALAVMHRILPVAIALEDAAPPPPRMITVGRSDIKMARALRAKGAIKMCAKAANGSTANAILAQLAGGEKSTQELYAALGKTPSSVSSALTALKQSGRIAKAGYGRWKLDAGEPAKPEKTPPAAAVVPPKSSRLGLIARLDRKLKERDPLEQADDLARRQANEG